MQLLPMASSPDGLISAQYAVITKTPGWGVLTTTRNVNVILGRNSLHQISVRGICSTVHDGGLHPAPCLRYTVGTAMHRALTFMANYCTGLRSQSDVV